MAKVSKKKNLDLVKHIDELFGATGRKLDIGGPVGNITPGTPPKKEDYNTPFEFIAAKTVYDEYLSNNPTITDKYVTDRNPDKVMDDMFRMQNTDMRVEPALQTAAENFNPPMVYPAKGKKAKGNWQDGILPALAGIDYLIPTNKPERQKVVRPQSSTDDNMYGRGSQAIMKNGGKMKKAKLGLAIEDPKPKPKFLMMSENYRDPNWSPKSQTQEATRAMDALVMDPVTARQVEVKDHLARRAAMFQKNNPGIDMDMYTKQRQQTLGSFNRDGDWVPNANYNQPGRYLHPDIVSSDVAVQKIQKSFDDGGSISKVGDNAFDGGTFQFNGPSHEQGGIDIDYNGVRAEVEGQETAAIDSEGSLNIFGNMIVPGTKKKFKTVAKELGKLEAKISKTMEKGSELLQESDPDDMFERLSLNSGKMKVTGSEQKMKKIAQSKELLATLQNEMLFMAAINGLEPKAMSEGREVKAKNGARLSFDPGGTADPPSVAKRHNNPGNIKFGDFAKKYGAVQGEPAKDGGYFAKFPDTQTGLRAIKGLLVGFSYANLTTEEAIKRWTNNTPYKIDLGGLKGRKVGELDQDELQKLVDVITSGEDNEVYGPSATGSAATPKQSKETKPEVVTPPYVYDPITGKKTYSNRNYPMAPGVKSTPYNPVIKNLDKEMTSAADDNRFKIAQIAPELGVIATNRVRPVPAQQFEPELYTPYQVSYQDMRNENAATFNAIQSTLSANPAALGTLAAQKYMSDIKVGAEEFRTNQGIENEVLNKNVALKNDAQFKNLGIMDTQMTRQETARSNTKRDLFSALNSIAAKGLQHELENVRVRTNEALFDYRYKTDEKGNIIGFGYAGSDPSFSTDGSTTQAATGIPVNEATTVRTHYDANSTVKSIVTRQDSQNKQALDKDRIQRNKLMNFDIFGRQSRGKRNTFE